jgi:uncharacterized membrane protein YbhN (UPF0104 family)
VLALVLQVAAAVGLAYVAGFSEVHRALTRFSWPWIVAVVAGLAVSCVGYFFAYRGLYRVEGGPHLPFRVMAAVVAGGFGGFFAHGGSALDDYALRGAGAERREARVRVSALAGMEHGVLALIGTVAGISILVRGLPKPPWDFSYSWAMIPVPGFALAFWLAERHRDRVRDRSGWRGRVGVFLDSIHLNKELHGPAVLGMALFWLADAAAMEAALAAFGFRMDLAAMFIGFGTGMVFTRRTGPLGGAGILMVVLPVTIWYSGAPLATAVAGVFAYRVLALWLPMPFAIATLPTLRRIGEEGALSERRAEPSGEPALRYP